MTTVPIAATPNVVKALAPTGTLRAAISIANPVLMQTDPATGATSGVAVDLAQELARRLGVLLEKVSIDSPGKCFEAVKRAACDIGFLAIEPARMAVIDFTAAYVIIEGVYAVRADGPLKANTDIDRAGVRVAVKKDTAYQAFLARSLHAATLVPVEDPFGAFVCDRLDAVAGVKQAVAHFVAGHPGLRMLDGRFMEIGHAMCLPKGREAGAAYLRAFVEEQKASGFIAEALRRADQEATVAAAA
jgi:polar amino acid transport system substrate-binding protein